MLNEGIICEKDKNNLTLFPFHLFPIEILLADNL